MRHRTANTCAFAKDLLSLIVCLCLLPACGDAPRSAGDDARFVPEGLSLVPASEGGNGAFSLLAYTLRAGPNNSEFYAALRNDGPTPACSPGLSLEFFDGEQQSLSRAVGGLLVRQFYRLIDGSGTLAACAGPGDVAMVAVLDLPSDLLDEVSHGVYWLTYWTLEIVPTDGIAIAEVLPVTRGMGVAYTGALLNGLDVAVSPSVAVFPVNEVGRPLAVAVGRGSDQVPPGSRWEFETTTVRERGAYYDAYPGGE